MARSMVLFIFAMGFGLGAVASGGPSPLATAPELVQLSVVVDDSSGGNGNGILEPGETADLQFTIGNYGTALAENIAATLYSLDPNVTINSRTGFFTDLLPGNTAISAPSQYSISLTTGVPCGLDLSMVLAFAADGYSVNRSFSLPLRVDSIIDLRNQNEDIRIYGSEAGDFWGSTDDMARGDVNGDGVDDLIISAEGADGIGNGKNSVGEFFIVFGNEFGIGGELDLAASSSRATRVIGIDASDVGRKVEVGDFNGDGYGDVAFAARLGDGPTGARPGAGEVWIIWGRSAWPLTLDLSAASSADFSTIFGDDDGDQFGYGISAGDFDDDGYDDLFVTAIGGQGLNNSNSNAGDGILIYGFSGMHTGNFDLDSSPGSVGFVYGDGLYNALGSEVVGGQFDADPELEILVSVASNPGPGGSGSGRPQVGQFWLLDAPTRGQVIDLATPPAGAVQIFGVDAADFARCMPGPTGDLDNDGLDEIILHSDLSNGPSNLSTNTGEIYIIWSGQSLPSSIDLMAPTVDVTTIYGAEAGALLKALAVGDMDGDNIGDLAVSMTPWDGPGGSRNNVGIAYVFFGGERLPPVVDLSSAPADLLQVWGDTDLDSIGTGGHFADRDGDGRDELYIGASVSDGPGEGRPNGGEIYGVSIPPRWHYSLVDSAYAWIDATTGTDLGLSCDSCCVDQPLDFDFWYQGMMRNTVTVCEDGYIGFAGVDLPNAVVSCSGDQRLPNATVDVFHDDFDLTSSGTVYALAEGVSPNRRLTIQWDQVTRWNSSGAGTFQVTLFETSNHLVSQYNDTLFGDAGDSGSTAASGIENENGAIGQRWSCFAATLTDNSAWRAIPFGTNEIWKDDMESGVNGWTAGGLWHQVAANCVPFSRSPSTSWYYGQTGSCDYDTGGANIGTLESPTISADFLATLDHQIRRQTEGGSDFDQSFVLLREDGGPSFTLSQDISNLNLWEKKRYDISASTGHTLQVEYTFDTVDGTNNVNLGWMIDDVVVTGCDVFGTSPLLSLAYARPAPVCETDAYLLDGAGSYAGSCTDTTYQWYEDGGIIGGATTLQYSIGSGHTTGDFDYELEVSCPSEGTSEFSESATVSVIPDPIEVPPPTFMLAKDGFGNINANWSNVSGGDLYTIWFDLDPSSIFGASATTGTSGVTGTNYPIPNDDLVFYLISAGNSTCGEGPKR